MCGIVQVARPSCEAAVADDDYNAPHNLTDVFQALQFASMSKQEPPLHTAHSMFLRDFHSLTLPHVATLPEHAKVEENAKSKRQLPVAVVA